MRSLVQKIGNYSGYPVTTKSENLADSDAARPAQQNDAAESHNRKPGLQSRRYDSMSPSKREQLLKQKAQDKARAKAKGKADPMGLLFANPESRGHANSPNVPGANFAFAPSRLTVQGQSDTMGQIHTASADLRRLARKRKSKLPGRSQRDEKYLEGGELPSNETESLYDHPYHGRRPSTHLSR